MKKIALSLASLLLAGTAGLANAGNAEAGKLAYESKGCVGCHGAAGISAAPIYPNLAGQKEQYLSMAFKAYKDGHRNSPNAASMKPMSMLLSDTEIADVAAYLAGLK
jgi:cytochrome c553